MYITGHRDFERRRVMPGAGTRPAIEVDQGDKAGRRAANDAQIHGQAHGASTDGALWSATNGNPDGRGACKGRDAICAAWSAGRKRPCQLIRSEAFRRVSRSIFSANRSS